MPATHTIRKNKADLMSKLKRFKQPRLVVEMREKRAKAGPIV
jgi:hypothetical protein